MLKRLSLQSPPERDTTGTGSMESMKAGVVDQVLDQSQVAQAESEESARLIYRSPG